MNPVQITLSQEQTERIIAEAKQEVVRVLLGRYADLELFTPSQVCGIFDCTPNTLAAMGLPKVQLIPGKMIRYRASDIQWLIESRTS